MSLCWMSRRQNEGVPGTIPIGTRTGRVSERIPICCPVKLSYGDASDQGRQIIRGRVLNMSASGALVEAARSAAVGSQVRIQGNELLTGTAFVRHSTRRLWRFRIGLEFARVMPNRY